MTIPHPTIQVVDDDDSFRRAITRLLKAAGYEVREYANCGEFLLAPPVNGPGCLILDVRMPGPSGLEMQEALKRQGNTLPIIFLTGHGDIPMSVQAIKAGAIDFLTKPVQREELLSAIRSALNRDARMRALQQQVTSLQNRYAVLTPRERSVFALVVQGRLNKQIASELGIAERTVKMHRARVMLKMRVDSLADLVRVAGRLRVGEEQP